MIKPILFCISLLTNAYWQSVEAELQHSDFIFERAFSDHGSHKDYQLALMEYPIFEKELDKLLNSERVKRAQGLLVFIDESRITNNWLEKRLQELKLRIARMNL